MVNVVLSYSIKCYIIYPIYFKKSSVQVLLGDFTDFIHTFMCHQHRASVS